MDDATRPDRPHVERTAVVADTAGSPAAAERRWLALAALTRVREGHLAPLVRVARVPDGVVLTHLLPAGTTTLEQLRAEAPLRAGHVVSVALDACDALAALHDAGLAHGGLSSEHLLLAPDGSLTLAATGAAWRRPPGEPGGPSAPDDIADLGASLHDLLGAAPGSSALVLATLRAVDPDPRSRPDARGLRDAIERCGRAEPLVELLWRPSPRIDPRNPFEEGSGSTDTEECAVHRLGAAHRQGLDVELLDVPGRDAPQVGTAAGRLARPPRRAREPRVKPPRRVVGRLLVPPAVVLALVLLVGAARTATGLASAAVVSRPPVSGSLVSGSLVASPPAAQPPTSSPAAGTSGAGALHVGLDPVSPAPDWDAVLTALDAGRRAALGAGSAPALVVWVDPTGAAWQADSALAHRVATEHAVLTGGALETLEVRTGSASGIRAVLEVRDRRASYTVTVGGRATAVPARAPRWWTVTLVAYEGGTVGWRISDVVPTADPGPVTSAVHPT
jgi:eukaryotic-like serine/threonine-protein kinase